MADTINELLARLVQLKPDDTTELEAIRDLLLQCARDEANPDSVRTLSAEALLRLDDLLYGEEEDGGAVIGDVCRLLETAAEVAMGGEEGAESGGSIRREDRKEPSAERDITGDEGLDQDALSAPRSNQDAATGERFSEELPPDADLDLLQDFVTESYELIDAAEAALLDLEVSPDDAESVNTVFRAFHTIKGTAGFLGLTSIKELAHRAENLLSRIREGEIRYAGGYADLALRSLDMMKELIQGLEVALGGGKWKKPSGYERLYGLLENPEGYGISDDPFSTGNVGSAIVGSFVPSGSGGDAQGDVSPESGDDHSKSAGAGGGSRGGDHDGGHHGAGELSVRVRTDRLDRLIDMVGELVIAHSMVAQDELVCSGRYQELSRKTSQVGKIVRELQDLSMSLRMVPLKPLFQKVNRLVRDLSVKAGKRVSLVTRGEETEIDRNMVDVLRDPLVHMVRNAVDHGIESPEERRQRGKSEEGTIVLEAYHSGGNVVVELRDDGRGLNREKILEKAVQRGLIESGTGLSNSEIYDLIFIPGFSTADKISEVSGRGVGMDVVKRSIEALHGRVDVDSEWGKGTCFKMILPLTMAITDGMLVQAGEERYIIPTVNIVKTFRPEPQQLSTVAGKGEMVLLRGELLPLYRLHRLFQIPGAVADPCAALLVIITSGPHRYALLVDELVGQQQVVAKSLGKAVGRVAGISGAAILGDGRVGLILDTTDLVTLTRSEELSGVPDHPSEPVPVGA